MDLRIAGKLLLLVGLALVCVGALLLLFGKLPVVGRLPGDIHIQKRGFSFYFPLTTCLLFSVLFTILWRIFLKK